MSETNHLVLTECRKITAEEQQQEFCGYLGYQSEIIWDEYDPDIHSDIKTLLLRKINLIFGDEIDDETIEIDGDSVPTTPSSDGSTTGEKDENIGDQQICKMSTKKAKSIEKFKKMKEKLVNAIWKQRKYNKDILLMSPIFVALVTDYEEYGKNLTWCKYSLNYSLHPVFRILKCRKNGMSHGCCMIFVDEHARVYQNWDEFKSNNDYPPGYLVAPVSGVYNTNENIAAILINGVGTLNGVYAIFLKKQDGEDISMLEILQFSSSLFIFTHSVYNFQTAANIVRTSRVKTIGEYRRGLSRSQQKAFDKLVKETIRQKGTDAGHVDVIRSLRSIQDTKQFFGDAYKVNKELNKNNVRMSLHPDGEILLNDAKSVDPTELRNTLKQVAGEDVFANLPTIPESHPAGAPMNLNENKITTSSGVSRDHVTVVVGLIKLGTFVRNQEDLESALINLANQVTIYVFDIFVDFMRSYFTENCRWISDSLDVPVPFEDVFRTTLNIIVTLATNCGVEIGEYVENIDWNFLRLQINEFYNELRNRRERRGHPTEVCKICSGSYYA